MVNVDIEKGDYSKGRSSATFGTKDSTESKRGGEDKSTDGASTSSSTSPEEKKESSPPAPSFSKLLELARPEALALLVAFVVMVGAEATGLINPLFISRAYNFLINPLLESSERNSEINKIMATVIIIHFVGVAGGFIRAALMGAAGERIVARLRNEMYSNILRQEISFFDEHNTGELVSRLGSDTTLLQQGISLAVPEVAIGIVKLFVAIGLMFWLSPELAGVTIAFTIFIFTLCVPFGKLIGFYSKVYQDILGEAQTRSTEALGTIRTVQSFTAEIKEEKRYQEKIGIPSPWWLPPKDKETTYKAGIYKSLVTSGFFTIVFGLGFGSMFFSLWYGFRLVNDGRMTLGDLTAFQSYIFQIGASLGQTGNFVSQLLQAHGASGRVFELLERIPNIPTPPPNNNHENKDEESQHTNTRQQEIQKPDSMRGAITFENVFFSYPSRSHIAVLKNFSLEIPENTTAALVGSSGAGKSTVVSLLQRFYDVNADCEGCIKIDGIDIRNLDLHWMRSHIGYVQQEPQLFGVTVRENICYGLDRDVSDDEIEEVCVKANAHDFIMSWPNGYETLVGERGIKLSGGQKQRIAIARALLVNPRILLLDEATSALDSESEALVQDAIEKAMVGRTVIIVAHRLSTITRAEQIVVVDDHEISDVGTHADLLNRCEKYQDLIKRQSVIGMAVPRASILEKE